MAEDNSWKTPSFRQNVVQKIDQAIQRSGMPTSKSSIEMENHVYLKAKSKDEYLGYVARLILHVREINSNKKAQQAQLVSNAPTVQDPINALQSMARQGSGNQIIGVVPSQGAPVVTAILQTINQRPGLHNKMQAVQPGMLTQVGGPSMTTVMNQATGLPMPNTTIASSTASGTSAPPIATSIGGQMPATGSMGSPMPGQITQLQGASMAAQLAQRKGPDGMMMQTQTGGQFITHRPILPNQFVRQSSPPSQPSPLGMQGGPVPSPICIQSPGTPQMPGHMLRAGAMGMAPSPNSNISLNTPMSHQVATPSPCNEDQAYREKIKQLSRYIDPLKRMIARIGNDDVEKLSKMKKLLEILQNPGQRMPLETLLKCEEVLKKLDFRRPDGFGGPMITTSTTRDLHPLIEALTIALQSPYANHTLYRTFAPCLQALSGPPLKTMPKPLRRRPYDENVDDSIGETSHVLQGEIAKLDPRYQVLLDHSQQSGGGAIRLICSLDDKHLPCLPPILLIIPEDYPNSSPKCHLSKHEYSNTDFLSKVQKSLELNINRLPVRYSVSELLDTWEMSVRQACSPE